MRGRTASGTTFDVGAFVRPAPVDAAIDDIASRLAVSRIPSAGPPFWSGRRTVVTGASRGFGAAIAKAAAVEDAQVVLHYRGQRASAEAVAEEARRYTSVTLLQADLGTDADAASFAAEILEDGAPDVLLLNATPPIEAAPATEMLGTTLASFVSRSLAMVHGPCRELVPHMAPGAVVVVVSSCYDVELPPKFAHYVAAKAAIEALFLVLAKEHPSIRFVVARAPRMLTDQTNVVGADVSALASAADVAVRLITAISTSSASLVNLSH